MKRLTENFAVAPQISPDDLAALAKAGFKSIICNRPDGETEGQPPLSTIVEEARSHGIEVRHIPVVGNSIYPDDVAAMRNAASDMAGPILAYCRTGTRSTILWAMANPEGLSREERLRLAAEAGYDLTPFVTMMP